MEYFNEEHNLFRESLREFLNREVSPNIEVWEKDGKIPKSIWKKMGDMGFLGLSFPEKYGGGDLDFFFEVIFNEELGRLNSGGFVVTQQVVQYMSAPYIHKYGSDTLKDKYLPGIISGDLISCIGITEPDAGSDTKNIQTRAELIGNEYVINGSKTFITNGLYGDFIILVVKTNPKAGSKGVSLICVDLDQNGITKNKINKLGWHSSDTAELSFDNVRVPKENLIGEEGKGFYYLMNGLQLERLCFLPSNVATMEYALSESLNYMSQRNAFGRTIDKFQVLRHRISQLSSELEALKAFSYYCCDLFDKGIYDVKSCSMGKLIVTELHEKISTQCLQFFGGNGYTEDYPMARMFRDSRIGTIGGGTSEIMREIIAKVVIDDVRYEKEKSNINSKVSSVNTNFSNQDNFSSLEKLDKHDLTLATKTITIAENTINITIKHINQTDNNGERKSSSQVIRHQIAQLASEIECSKQFILSINNKFETTKNLEKQISMAKLTSMQLMDRVVSECFDMFESCDSLDQHPLEKTFQRSKMIQISNSKRNLHDNISKLIIEK
ncbi:MAG: acyl-CoA dehydrogenase family protein [Flavobacteriaceae bacterium]|nr:acyl-CoA dehydrogenase family protein [Flavobacteriaceae bacterium]